MVGKEIGVEMTPLDETIGGEIEKLYGLPPHPGTRDAAQRLILYYNNHGLCGSTNVMKWILGREPMSWEEWVQAKMDELEGKGFDLRAVRHHDSDTDENLDVAAAEKSRRNEAQKIGIIEGL